MAKTVVNKQTEETALATQEQKEKREALKAIKSVEDIVKAFGGKVVEVREVVGDFALVDSMELVDRPFMVAHWEIRKSDEFGKYNEDGVFEQGEYVSTYVITSDEKAERLIFNDGGTGIRPTLENFTAVTGQTGGLNCPFGLRASSYEVVTSDGQKSKATTMYFATSKPKKS